MTTNLSNTLALLYWSEINCSIETLWDGGWDVKLGDAMNGFGAETTILAETTAAPGSKRSVDDVLDGLSAVASWLDAKAREHFPLSDYALARDETACLRNIEQAARALVENEDGPTLADTVALQVALGITAKRGL